MKYADILAIYDGSDGDATKRLYARLEQNYGPLGFVAVNVFRATKASARAKVYRGRGYRDMAYERKQWAMGNLCTSLTQHAESLGIVWGWGRDADEPSGKFPHVLYVELPTGQVSFHCAHRLHGPDFPCKWDGVRRMGPIRICQWIEQIFGGSHGTEQRDRVDGSHLQSMARVHEGGAGV